MGKKTYIGVDDLARKVKKAYIGVDGVARKIKKMYIGDSSGVARCIFSSVVEAIFKGIVYSYSSNTYFSFKTRSGETLSTAVNNTLSTASDSTTRMCVSKSGEYISFSKSYLYVYVYKYSGGKYSLYQTFKASDIKSAMGYYTFMFGYNGSEFLPVHLTEDGSYLMLASIYKKTRSDNTLYCGVLIYKNTGTEFEYLTTIDIASFVGSDYANGMTSVSTDSTFSYIVASITTRRPSSTSYYEAHTKVLKKSQSNFSYSEICSSSNEFSQDTGVMNIPANITEDGKYYFAPSVSTLSNDGYHTSCLYYLNNEVSTYIMDILSNSYLRYPFYILKRPDSNNAYITITSGSSAHSNFIKCYKVDGANVTLLGKFTHSPYGTNKDSIYADELNDGIHAIIGVTDSEGNNSNGFYTVSKDENGLITAISKIASVSSGMAAFVDREY